MSIWSDKSRDNGLKEKKREKMKKKKQKKRKRKKRKSDCGEKSCRMFAGCWSSNEGE